MAARQAVTTNYIQKLSHYLNTLLSEQEAQTALKIIEKYNIPIIPYKTINGKGGRKVIPALKKYRDWLRKEQSPELWEWIVRVWEEKAEKREKNLDIGIMLGPPAEYLIMIDIDSDAVAQLFEENRKEWAKLTRAIIDYIDHAIDHNNKIDKWRIESAALIVRSRRGGHLIYRMEKEDWEKLHAITKANKKLGKITITVTGKAYEAEIEIRTLGVTPLYSYKHQLVYAPSRGLKPLSFRRLQAALEKLGLKLETSKQLSQYNNDNSTRETQPQQTKNTNDTNGRPAHEEKQQKEEREQRSIENSNQTRQTGGRATPEQTRRLTEQQITTIVNTIYPYWVPGHRNALELALVGWLIKANITEEQAVEVIRRITEAAGDEEKDKRIEEVYRQYRLVKTGERDRNELIGKTGLLEELQKIILEQNPGIGSEEARDRALQTLHTLEQILGPRRSRIIMTVYETGKWFVNDPRRGILLLKVKETEEGEVRRYRQYISDWYVKQVLIVKGGAQYLYKILFRNARTGEKHVISGQLDEIVKQLKRMHGVKRTQILFDAISAIVSEFKRRKLAKYKHVAEVAGILPTKNGVKFVRAGVLSIAQIPKELDIEKARQALELLIQLRKHYDNNKFDIAINWAAYAPAGYALKVKTNTRQLYLLLYGERKTGKTTLARIIKLLYNVKEASGEDPAEEAQSEYRLAATLNLTTLPVLADEVQGISHKPTLIGLLKRAASGTIIRWRGDTGKKYYARAAVIFTSNFTELIEDQALADRLIQLEFTPAEKVTKKTKQEQEEFKRLYKQYSKVAGHLGAVILQTIVEKWEDIDAEAALLHEKTDYIKLGQWIWKQVAEKLGVNPPPWATEEIQYVEEQHGPSDADIFWYFLKTVIRNTLERAHNKVYGNTLLEKMWSLNKLGLLPAWLHMRSQDIIITRDVILDLQKYGLRHRNLKNLAEELGVEYGTYTVNGRSVRGIRILHKHLKLQVASPEELALELIDEIELQINLKQIAPDEDDIAHYIQKHYGLDLDLALQVAEALLEMLEKQ